MCIRDRSQIKAFPHDNHGAAHWSVPDVLFNDRHYENERYLNSLAPGLERQVALWCMNNLTTLRDPEHGRAWLVVYYEDLVLDPAKELARIAEAWKFDTSSLLTEDLRKASATDFGKDLKTTPEEQLGKWIPAMDPQMSDRVQAVLDHFGITFYSARAATPIHHQPIR